jgi:hypothetical protein
MEINYIIHTHINPKQLKRLIDRLNNENVNFYVHLDKKTINKQFQSELSDFKNVYFFKNEERISIFWGGISQVEATILAIKKISKDNRTGYCVLLSGQDYPIKSNEHINLFFEKDYGKNFISGVSMKSKLSWKNGLDRIEKYNFHPSEKRVLISLPSIYEKSFYTRVNLKNLKKVLLSHEKLKLFNLLKKRSFPKYLSPYGGSNWWALPIETIHHINSFIETHPDYLSYHNLSHCPDEIFFHSILFAHFEPNSIAESVTYVNWSRKNCPLPVTFTNDDFMEITSNNKLFARKFDIQQDSEILDKIDSII